MKKLLTIGLVTICMHANAQQISKVWVADNKNGTFKNPVINADYSDPDAIRVGDDFYMIASSFNHIPGLPILHSKGILKFSTSVFHRKSIVPSLNFNSNSGNALCFKY